VLLRVAAACGWSLLLLSPLLSAQPEPATVYLANADREDSRCVARGYRQTKAATSPAVRNSLSVSMTAWTCSQTSSATSLQGRVIWAW
jgi:hypothetical protein